MHPSNKALALATLLLCSCAPSQLKPTEDAAALLNYACRPGETVKSAQGTIGMKAQSNEATGQFPASVLATAPDHLRLEATNLLGGTEAVITVEGSHYQIDVPSRKDPSHPEMGRMEEGVGTWAGIPLEWATQLFLGRIPCPPAALSKDTKLQVDAVGNLIAETPAFSDRGEERFVYHFRTWQGKPWPETLHWERKGSAPISVDFKFEDPEDRTDSPRKWEAKSPRGEVKIRWRDRQLTN